MKTKFIFPILIILLTYTTGLAQNPYTFTVSPNPFATSTELTIHNLLDDTVTLRIYNRWGNVVASFFEQEVLSGTITVTFNADTLANDVYVALLLLNSGGVYADLIKTGSTSSQDINPSPLPAVLVFPNPTTGRLTISTDLNITGLELYDNNGRQLWQSNGQEKTIDLQHVDPGIYLLHLVTKDRTYIEKIIRK